MKSINQKDIEQLYEYIINKDVEGANQFVNNQNSKGFSKVTLLEYLRKYVRTLSNDAQERFKDTYDWFLSSSFEYFKVTMSLMEEMTETGKIKVDYKTDFAHLRTCLSSFVKKYPKYSEEITVIRQILTKEQETLQSNNSTSFFQQESHTATYEDKLYMVATSAYPSITFSRIGWSEKYFKQVMIWFKNKYSDEQSIVLAEQFEKWFYESLKQRSEKQMIEDFEICVDEYAEAKQVLYELLSSGVSIYEYCHTHGKYSVSEIKKYIRKIYSATDFGNKKVSEVISEIESREQNDFIEELNNIAFQIQNNPNFTILDYYHLTKLSLDDFYDKIGFYSLEVSKFVNSNSVIKRIGMGMPVSKFSQERELRVSRVIKGREITKEEKELIFKYLEENNIPIDQYTYRACLNKLINNDLEFNQKLKTYAKGSF